MRTPRKKKWLALLLAAVMVFGLLPVSAAAAGEATESVTIIIDLRDYTGEVSGGFTNFVNENNGALIPGQLNQFSCNRDYATISADFVLQGMTVESWQISGEMGVSENDLIKHDLSEYVIENEATGKKEITYNAGDSTFICITAEGNHFALEECTDDDLLFFWGPGTVLTFTPVISSGASYTATASVEDSSQGIAAVAATDNANEYTITATPKDGYAFAYWLKDNAEDTESNRITANPYTVALTADATFTAHFTSISEPSEVYAYKVSSGEAGANARFNYLYEDDEGDGISHTEDGVSSVDLSIDKTAVHANCPFTVNTTLVGYDDVNYTFDHWEINGKNLDEVSITGATVSSRANGSRIRLQVLFETGSYLTDLDIVAVFAENTAPAEGVVTTFSVDLSGFEDAEGYFSWSTIDWSEEGSYDLFGGDVATHALQDDVRFDMEIYPYAKFGGVEINGVVYLPTEQWQSLEIGDDLINIYQNAENPYVEIWADEGFHPTESMSFAIRLIPLTADFDVTAESADESMGTVVAELVSANTYRVQAVPGRNSETNEEYYLDHWTVNGEEKDLTEGMMTVVPTEELHYVAYFGVCCPNCEVRIEPENAGSVSSSPAYGPEPGYSRLKGRTLNCYESEGYSLDYWERVSTGETYTGNKLYVECEEGEVFIAHLRTWNKPECLVEPNIEGIGYYNANRVSGDTFRLNAGSYNSEYIFDYWTKEGSEERLENGVVITAQAGDVYIAHFKNVPKPPLTVYPAECTCTVSAYHNGSTEDWTFWANESDGWTFLYWKKDGSDEELSNAFTAPPEDGASYTAYYREWVRPKYAVDPEGAGTVYTGRWTGDTWSIRAEKEGLYTFVKWTWDEGGESTNINLQITSTPETADRVYTAHFVHSDIDLQLNAEGAKLCAGPAHYTSIYGWDQYANNNSVPYAGGRAQVVIPFTVGATFSPDITVELRAGDEVLCTNVNTNKEYGVNANQQEWLVTYLDPVPAGLTELTVRVTLSAGGEDSETQEITFPVTVKTDSAENSDFRYLTTPRKSSYYSFIVDRGPEIDGVYAEIDPESKQLLFYIYGARGVFQLVGDGEYDLVELTGLPSAGATSSEGVFGLGPDGKGGLIAVCNICTDYGSYNGLYTYSNGEWTKVEGSEFGNLANSSVTLRTTAGALVMGIDDIWCSGIHWNGEEWARHDYQFNSFRRVSDGEGWAQDQNGNTWKYNGGEWTQIQTESAGAAPDATMLPNWVAWNDLCFTFQDFNGDWYAAVPGRNHKSSDSFGGGDYAGSDIYKWDGEKWVYQIMSDFNDPEDDMAEIQCRIRPDGVRRCENPIEGVTFLHGGRWGYGSAYLYTDNREISFETNGGSVVDPLTAPIATKISPPASPIREGYTFLGWYTLESFLTNGPAYTWGLMPAEDITLYAKWTEDGPAEDPFATEREKALASLDTALSKLNENDYEEDIWAQITAAHEAGRSSILAAATYEGIYAALNAAVDEINALAQNIAGEITVAVTVEKFTVDGKYIVEPTLVKAPRNALASVVLTDLLKAHYNGVYDGKPYTMTGTEDSGFYLSGIYDADIDNFLSEFDGGSDSGWMYCVNGSFPGVGASGWLLCNKDVMRWQYTCTGLGADIGNNNEAFGGPAGIKVADKDALIWKVAELRSQYSDPVLKANAVYRDALAVLKDIPAAQEAVDAALAALNGLTEEDLIVPLKINSITADKTTAETGETIIWTAEAAGGSGEYTYCFYIYKDGTAVKKTGYTPSASLAYAPEEAGAYSAKVFVKDSAGAGKSNMGGSVTVTQGASAPLKLASIAADKTTAETGETVTWKAEAAGGSGGYTYCFYVYKDGAAVKKTGYAAADTLAYTPTEAGTYSVKVFVKDSSGAGKSSAGGSVTVTQAAAGPLKITGITADKTTAETGDTITWKAEAAGGSGGYTYCFYIYKDGAVVKSTGYSGNDGLAYTPEEAGSYKAKVFVKDSSGAGKSSAGGVVTVAQAANAPLKISSITADKTAAGTGETVTWTAKATGGSGGYTYCFYIYKDGAVVKKTGYAAADSLAYTPTEAGTYSAKVFVKDSSGAGKSSAGGKVTVAQAADAPLSITGLTASKTTAKAGETLTWTATAAGGSGSCTYCFYLYKDGAAVKKTGYTANASFSYKVEEAGAYSAKVFVKDSSGASKSRLGGNVTVTEK